MKKNFVNIKSLAYSLKNMLDKEAHGSGTLEMVLIIVVVLGILVLFRDNIEQLMQSVFSKISTQINSF